MYVFLKDKLLVVSKSISKLLLLERFDYDIDYNDGDDDDEYDYSYDDSAADNAGSRSDMFFSRKNCLSLV